MLCTGYTKVWELARNEIVRLDGARGTTLRVTSGGLWITLENDKRDIVLTAGDSYTIDRGGLTLVEAQDQSTVCVLASRRVAETLPFAGRATKPGFIGWLAATFAPDDMGGYSPYY